MKDTAGRWSVSQSYKPEVAGLNMICNRMSIWCLKKNYWYIICASQLAVVTPGKLSSLNIKMTTKLKVLILWREKVPNVCLYCSVKNTQDNHLRTS